MPNAVGAQGTKLYIGDDIASSPIVYTQIKGFKSWTGFDGKASEIDATDLDSTAKEYLMGLQDFGNFSATVNYLRTDPGQVACRAAKAAQELVPFKIVLPDAAEITFEAYVTEAPFTGGVDDLQGSTLTLRISGDVTGY